MDDNLDARNDPSLKEAVRQHWNAQPCGTRDLPPDDRRRFFDELERERYGWEPYIRDFARFEDGKGKRLLEVGVGAGTDFINWVRKGAVATGVDLTEQGVSLTRERLALEGLSAEAVARTRPPHRTRLAGEISERRPIGVRDSHRPRRVGLKRAGSRSIRDETARTARGRGGNFKTERFPCLSSSVGSWPWPASSASSSRTAAISA